MGTSPSGVEYAWYISQSSTGGASTVADLGQNVAPVADAPDRSAQRNQRISAATLFTVSDANNDPITRYQFWDETAGNGAFFIGGIQQSTGVAIDVSAAQLSQTEFRTTGAGGSDVLWVRAFDGTAWGAWDRFVVTAPTNRTPVADAPDRALVRNQTYAASSLFTASDADGDAITQYQFWDETAGNGAFFIGGVQQATGMAINVSAGQLSQTDFRTTNAGGSDVLWVRAFDGTAWGAWYRFVVTAPANRAPIADASDRTLVRNQ
ncbi:MAG: hypothetical protein KGP27_14690, partial [Hyphomicrobiales bacterium]|nr:hypothetical protein [Hyphomicrobiales bacterium]